MNARRVLAILGKDLRDAWRDGRIGILLIMPVAIALIPALGGTQDDRPATDVAVVEQAGGRLSAELQHVAAKGVDIRITRVPNAAAARRLVAAQDAEVAVVVTPAPAPQPATILVGAGASPAAQSVVALVPDAVLRAQGRRPAVGPRLQVVAPTDRKPADVLGSKTVTSLASIIMLLIFVGMMVVPMLTAEELETGTFGALRLAATAREVLAAKALAGCAFGLGGAGLIVAVSGLAVHAPVLFFGAALALVVSLVGFGLLLGILIRNTTAINTYAGFLVIPLLGSAIAVFFTGPGALATLLDVLPFSQAAKVLADATATQKPFDAGPVAWLVIAAWAALGYAALTRIVARREV